METRKEVFESVKDGVVGTIRGTGDVAKEIGRASCRERV